MMAADSLEIATGWQQTDGFVQVVVSSWAFIPHSYRAFDHDGQFIETSG